MEKRGRIGLTIYLPLRPKFPTHPSSPPLPSFNSGISMSQTNQFDFSEFDRVNLIGSINGHAVYKVIHRSTGRLYALKIFRVNDEDDSVRCQISRDVELQRGLDHPNIVKCHDMVDHNGELQVLLNHMDGGSLAGKHITDEQRLSNISLQILVAIAYVHGQRKVHRNLKPSNLLVNAAQNNVKIADFGVSRILAETTGPTDFVGTIAYMSPERINTDFNHGVYNGFAGDIWGFGLSILEVYMGRFPIAVERQGDWASLTAAICASIPLEAPPNASTEFRDFIACCLQREPERRWSAVQLLQHPFILQCQVNQ